jgi:hypothetical protein
LGAPDFSGSDMCMLCLCKAAHRWALLRGRLGRARERPGLLSTRSAVALNGCKENKPSPRVTQVASGN